MEKQKFYLLSLEGFVYVWKYEKNEIEMLYDEKKIVNILIFIELR